MSRSTDLATDTDEPGVAEPEPLTGRRATSLYRAVWRWHFYAGLFAIPVIVMLCLTGIVYLFKPQLDGLLYGSLRDVTPGASVVDYGRQLDTVTAQFPDGSVDAVMPQPAADRSTQFEVTAADGTPWSAYLDPYTGTYLGARNHNHDPSYIALQIHGSMWSGAWLGWLPGSVDPALWGDWYIELVACWTLVLLVSGVYLWWPRGRSRRRAGGRGDGVLVPRWNTRNRRIRWRDVHAITGVLFSFVTAFFLISGLVWTGFWSPQVLQRAMDVTKSVYPAALLDGREHDNGRGGAPGAEWASAPRPDRAREQGGAKAGHHGAGTSERDERGRRRRERRQKALGSGYAIFMPADETGSYTALRGADVDPDPVRASGTGRTVFIDQYTAQPLVNIPASTLPAIPRAIDFSVALHEGREWGWVSQVLALLGTLALLVSVATSLVMWRARRPKGLGAPRREPGRPLMVGVTVITLGLGVLFPLLGASVLLALALEFLLLRRVPRLARAFGTG